MEMIDLSGKFLLEAMFEKLSLPLPHYFTGVLEQGGYAPAAACIRTSVAVELRMQKNRASAMNSAAAQAISHRKVLVDYSHAWLQQAEMTNKACRFSGSEKVDKRTEN